jgi:hypothetical protein
MAVHEVDRDTPLPSPLTAEVVAVASPDSTEAADRLFIGLSSEFSTRCSYLQRRASGQP